VTAEGGVRNNFNKNQLKDRMVTKNTDGLLTDLYQLTMAYGYWKLGMERQKSVFHSFFRRLPFNGGFSVFCGLDPFIEFTENFGFTEDDLSYLAELKGNDGKPLFEEGFLSFLKTIKLTCDIDAVKEGSLVFPYEPLVRITGPLIQCQLLETPLLNFINFQTLIATKAARVCAAAKGDPVLEFGLRRAHGRDGALSASRAAYVGGCAATSNVLAGKTFGIPVKGTIAHSWVMAFEDELEAFKEYAGVLPNNSILLVDTYSTLDGVRKSVVVGKELKAKGYQFDGIRIDSGDLFDLAKQARKILDENGLKDAKIVASNDLDEYQIEKLKKDQAPIDIWGVGTRLVTAYDQPAHDGVYKLSAIQKKDGVWKQVIKLSEQTEKTTIPGVQQVRRYTHKGKNIADVIYDEEEGLKSSTMFLLSEELKEKTVSEDTDYSDLLVPIVREGRVAGSRPSLTDIRERVKEELSSFDPDILSLKQSYNYPVGLEKSLYKKRVELIERLKKKQVH
jgi:nicotinate phosphoribosyltransferase